MITRLELKQFWGGLASRKWDSLASHLISTAVTSLVIVFLGIFVFHLAARMGPANFGVYGISRRTISFLSGPALLGLAVALTRFVAMSGVRGGRSPSHYLLDSVLLGGFVGCSVVAIAVLFPSHIASILFGGSEHRAAVLPSALILLGVSMQGVVYAYLRGTFQQHAANLLQIAVLGVCPVAAFFISSQLVPVLTVTAALAISISMLALAICLRRAWTDFGDWTFHPKSLLKYGLPRVPGDLALSGLFLAPVLVAAHSQGVEGAGPIAFGLAVVTAGGSAAAPLSTLLLPHAARMFAKNGHGEIRRQVARVMLYGLPILMFGGVLLYLFARPVTTAFLGMEYDASVPALGMIFAAASPYALFIGLRSIVDAATESAINARNCYVVLLIYLGGLWLLSKVFPTPTINGAMFLVSLCTLAALTLLAVERETKV